jgi:3-methyladenine DNA glycosylase/8-oxoguanine DNA glycosylase
VARIVTQQRRGTGDPTFRVEASGALRRGLRTPVGTAALKITVESTEVVGTAWGDGAEWALDALPALCGALDDPSGFTPHHEAVAQGWRRHPHLRLGRTGLVMEALVPSILEQKVTGKQAFGAFRQLVTRHGERAPGPYADLFVQPSPQAIAQIPSWEWLKLQVDPVRSKTLVGACRRAVALERVAVLEDAEEVDRRLRSLPGIGVWTAAEVRQRALGDADAVSFGDYHLAHHVGWALFGHDIDDTRLAEVLECYRPQRGRAATMAVLGGQARPRRGPRMSVPTHLPTW